MINVYVAAPWLDMRMAKEAAQILSSDGRVHIVSTWHEGPLPDPALNYTHEALTSQAVLDLRDLRTADLIVVIAARMSEGKAFELGVAYERHLPCIVVGSGQQNIFYHLPGITRVTTYREALDLILAHGPRIVVY